MTATGKKRAGRRFRRRPILLLVLGLLVSSLGAVGAFAAVVVGGYSAARSHPLSIRVSPPKRTVTPGSAASYLVRVARDSGRPIGLSGRTGLAVRAAGLPAGAGVVFSSPRTLGADFAPRSRTTLTISTTADTPPGTYEVRLSAHRPDRTGSAAVWLTVTTPPPGGQPSAPGSPPPVVPPITPPGTPVVAPDAFEIAGVLQVPLTPGTGEPLDLTLTNLESTDLVIESLNVRPATVSGPRVSPAHACDSEDFAIQQFSGATGFTLAGSSSVDLAELGFDPAEWPAVSMLNRAVNQDGCKGATLTLAFSGTAIQATS
jgi:hypothetical protein